ncbi:alpha/beta hydrolase [Acidovorax sp.]|uniref:alpha/beta hydrolase n=1 Tax=Acidovorax sp. TaxID=1872122 RepID=UPI002622B8AD|nr:alpha/beta hydrolase [Acidovorax sp.]
MLAEVGATWGKDVPGNIRKTIDAYTPLLATSPKGDIRIIKDIPYGPGVRNLLDVYQPRSATSTKQPIVVFLHGGAYVRGERNLNAEIYANVPTYFARHGMLGVNATYQLAPASKWPSAAQDVGEIVRWLKLNAEKYGGDPERIFLIGHSAGATHIATYAFNPELQAQAGTDVAGLVLLSGRYEFDPKADDPNLAAFQAYFGTDRTRYPQMSPISHIATAPRIPLFIGIAEYDNPDLDMQGALLYAAVCKRDRACPRFLRMEHHNHVSMVLQFNTEDEQLGAEILNFVQRGR